MRLDTLAAKYLATLEKGDLDQGISFRDDLAAIRLDYSWDSLTRIDRLLDQLRLRCKPEQDRFFADPANQNFLYLLGFYAGEVFARHCAGEIHWYDYAQMIESMPGMKYKLTPNFGTSIGCIVTKGDKRKDTYTRRLFVPLASIQERLFETYPGKSLQFSARSALF